MFGRLVALLVGVVLTAGEAHAQIATDPAKAERFNAFVEQAQTAIGHWAYNRQLDVMRAKRAAGFELSQVEQIRLAEMAFDRGCAIEAEAVLAPLAAAGKYGGHQGARDAAILSVVTLSAEAARAGDVSKSERWAARQRTGAVFIATGEAQFATGDYERALDLIQKGIAKGGLEPEDAAFAQLQLGIAQYGAGDVSDAKATWTAIRSDSGAQEIAQAWMVIASD